MHLKTAEFGRQSREEMKEGRMQKGGALKTVRSEAEPRNEKKRETPRNEKLQGRSKEPSLLLVASIHAAVVQGCP